MRPIHKPICNEADYRAALALLGKFFDPDPYHAPQDEADYFEVLATLVEAYEARHYPIDLPDPIEAIQFRMEQTRV